jgi:hypothetical protein
MDFDSLGLTTSTDTSTNYMNRKPLFKNTSKLLHHEDKTIRKVVLNMIIVGFIVAFYGFIISAMLIDFSMHNRSQHVRDNGHIMGFVGIMVYLILLGSTSYLLYYYVKSKAKKEDSDTNTKVEGRDRDSTQLDFSSFGL